MSATPSVPQSQRSSCYQPRCGRSAFSHVRCDSRATSHGCGSSRPSREPICAAATSQGLLHTVAAAACCAVLAGPAVASHVISETHNQQSWGAALREPALMAAAPQLSELFSSQAQDSFNDPVDPFTLYGTVFRKYLIEKLEGEKVVSRKKGITTVVCTSALPAALETPEVQFLPLGEKARLAGNAQCRKAETPVRTCWLRCSAPDQLCTSLHSCKPGTTFVLPCENPLRASRGPNDCPVAPARVGAAAFSQLPCMCACRQCA
eukprot:jgi/Ulvmu1/12865/UM098_0050.1